MLVESQGELLDTIEYSVSQSLSYTKTGVQELEKANEYARKSRKKMCILIAIVVVVIIVVRSAKPLLLPLPHHPPRLRVTARRLVAAPQCFCLGMRALELEGCPLISASAPADLVPDPDADLHVTAEDGGCGGCWRA